MDLKEKAAQLPLAPGVYLFKGADGTVIYVGKAKILRHRVRSYFNAERLAEAKTGRLIRTATDLDFIQVDTEKEALALENTLIKRHKPRFNILLRDDKTYPYIKVTNERVPRAYVTRKVFKDGASYFGPFFPANLAWRLLEVIHRYFRVPSCRVDMDRKHNKPCLQYHIRRCHGPCVDGLIDQEEYKRAIKDVKLFLQGKTGDLMESLEERMMDAAANERYEEAARLRDLMKTVEEVGQKQKMASAGDTDTDIFGIHAEAPLVAVNIFHLRRGHVVDRRAIFFEDQEEYEPGEFAASLLKQIYLNQEAIPAEIHVPFDFEDCDVLQEYLTERRGGKVEIHTPRRGTKKAMVDLVASNAKLSFDQRFRVLKPTSKAIQEAVQDALNLPEPPRRIECFDISHIQGTDKVASMVVWEEGRMKKADYRKFVIKTVQGNDDFASMREVVSRRYSRLKEEGATMPGLVLIDGGLGQLHAAAEVLEEIGLAAQPLASIAKREEIIYVYGMEDEPVKLDRHSPVLHLVQQIRDEAHRFAVTFHRTRRNASRLQSDLENVPGIGAKTVQKLLKEFGSVERVRQTAEDELAKSVGKAAARKIKLHYAGAVPPSPLAVLQ